MGGLLIPRVLKKAELQFKTAQDGLSSIKSIYDKVHNQVDALPKDDGSLLEKRRELQKEVDIAKRNLALKVILNYFQFSFFLFYHL